MNPGLEVLIYEREQRAQREAELEKLRRLTPLEFLCSVWQDPDLPMHTRLRAAAEHAKYSAPQLKAVAQVTPRDMASVLEKARERANGAKVVRLEVVPKALEHSPAELQPDHSRSAAQSPSGYRRRI
jgi:hypothetical protein